MKISNYNPYDREVGFIEKHLNCDDLIISKTDTDGIIKYANITMLRITDSKLDELVGKSHNISRHPDMPRAIFKIMWQTIEKGDDFHGFIKNLSKDGAFYWTYAFVTPDFNKNGTHDGYHSERRAPNPKAIIEIACLYQQLRAKENLIGIDEAIEWFKAEVLKGKSYSTYIHRLQNKH